MGRRLGPHVLSLATTVFTALRVTLYLKWKVSMKRNPPQRSLWRPVRLGGWQKWHLLHTMHNSNARVKVRRCKVQRHNDRLDHPVRMGRNVVASSHGKHNLPGFMVHHEEKDRTTNNHPVNVITHRTNKGALITTPIKSEGVIIGRERMYLSGGRHLKIRPSTNLRVAILSRYALLV